MQNLIIPASKKWRETYFKSRTSTEQMFIFYLLLFMAFIKNFLSSEVTKSSPSRFNARLKIFITNKRRNDTLSIFPSLILSARRVCLSRNSHSTRGALWNICTRQNKKRKFIVLSCNKSRRCIYAFWYEFSLEL
jgi:hypothetical protein